MKFVLLFALLALTIQASKLDSVTKIMLGIEDSTNLDLHSLIFCLDEPSSKAILKKFQHTTFTHKLPKFEQKALDNFNDCSKEGSKDIISEIKSFLGKKNIDFDSLFLGDIRVAQILTFKQLSKNVNKNLKSKNFTKAGLNFGKTALKIVNQAVKYRDFNRKDTNISIFVNAFDNIIMDYQGITITKSVSNCYKTAKDFQNMYDFLHEHIDNIKNNSTLSDKGKKLLNSLKTVNKCKSNTKPGKQLTKAAGFDFFSDPSDKDNHIGRESLQNAFLDHVKDGQSFGRYYAYTFTDIHHHGYKGSLKN